jgi:hypothetical protein
MKHLKSILILLLITVFIQAENSVITFYVSPEGNDTWSGKTIKTPFKTIEQAQRAIQDLKKNSRLDRPIIIYLCGGKYALQSPLYFLPRDSGTESCPITYKAFNDERPVLFGGREIKAWQKTTDGLWQTKIADVAEGKWRFRQLYVNGVLRRRARIPNERFLRVAGFPDGGREVPYHKDCQRFEYKNGDLDINWTNLQEVEVIVYHFWTDSHLPIQTIDTTTHIVTFKHKAGKVFTDDFTDAGARYIVENVLEGLDQPGEWYLNRKTGVLYYMPLNGEKLNEVTITAPYLREFVRMEGDAEKRERVQYINFINIAFEYSNWDLPPGNSNDRQGSTSVPAAITLKGATHCTFEGCTLKNLGTFAFELKEGCTCNRFLYNDIGYIAAGGFRVNGGMEKEHPLRRTAYNEIGDNLIHHYGEVFPSAVGILLMNTEGNRVEHNHIHHGWYTGISVGWQWGYQRSISRDNIIAYNHIHDIGQGLLSDMGGIYTLGVSPGTVLRNNIIHDVDANQYGGWGIYNDEGSTHILIENNVVYNTKFGGYNIHFAKEITVRNNIFALARIEAISRGRAEPHKSVFFENNIVYWTEGTLLAGNWEDMPYTFHFHPKDEGGTREDSITFEMDWNLYYNPNLQEQEVRFKELNWTEWQARGRDVHSLYADPLFVDPQNGDFSLKPDSPAFDLGFKPIDISNIGPRNFKLSMP